MWFAIWDCEYLEQYTLWCCHIICFSQSDHTYFVHNCSGLGRQQFANWRISTCMTWASDDTFPVFKTLVPRSGQELIAQQKEYNLYQMRKPKWKLTRTRLYNNSMQLHSDYRVKRSIFSSILKPSWFNHWGTWNCLSMYAFI